MPFAPDTALSADQPRIQRQRHEPRRRSLLVSEIERVTPHMIRVTLEGEDLADFISASPDDHVKVFVTDAQGQPSMRDYTPRRYNREARQLVIDFVDHDAGPASAWARTAKVGDALQVGGPRGSQVITGPINHWVLVGDESALPAIGRRVEEVAMGTSITTLVAVTGPEEEQSFVTPGVLTTHWAHRPASAAADATALLEKLAQIDLPERTFVWIAAEGGVARAVREALLAKGHPQNWMKAAGYWISGEADAAVKNIGEE